MTETRVPTSFNQLVNFTSSLRQKSQLENITGEMNLTQQCIKRRTKQRKCFQKYHKSSSLSSSRNWSNIIESMFGFMWRFFLRYAIHYNGFICNKYMKEDSCMDIEEIRSSSFRALKLIFMARKTYFLGHKFVWLFCGFLVRWKKNFQKLTKHPKVALMPFVNEMKLFQHRCLGHFLED